MEYHLVEKINARHCERIDDRIFETTGVNSRLLGCGNGEIVLFICVPLSWTKCFRETALKWAMIWRDENPELRGCNKVDAVISLVSGQVHKTIKGGVVASAQIKERLWYHENAACHYAPPMPDDLIHDLRIGMADRLN